MSSWLLLIAIHYKIVVKLINLIGIPIIYISLRIRIIARTRIITIPMIINIKGIAYFVTHIILVLIIIPLT